MRFCSLGSGSRGNATLIEARDGTRVTRVLVDCGFSLRELGRRAARRGVELAAIDAVFVTHEHGDHVGCALALARRHGTPLWMSAGTRDALATALGDADVPASLRVARHGDAIAVGALELRPFAVPHDAREPLQLTVGDGARRLALLTDLGSFDDGIEAQVAGCDAFLLECNHDRGLLADGPYPAFLKRRIGGDRGHLANDQAAALLRRCAHGALRHVVAAHLSVQNNRPELAAQALADALGADAADVTVAYADDGCDWLDLA
ncbi:MBL fold metallo-hydrolase [Azohydromonas sediminis]|uniref:MBL fold metallo-hydrolase n=1 Tax=Azohydromonas sediminis TaxID=2259674 RepID=UPI000E64C64A|nr:MBL fold metallo-hydrolase [Azohydromonas sediminis]